MGEGWRVWRPSLCVRGLRQEIGVLEIVCGVVREPFAGLVATLVMCSPPSARGRSVRDRSSGPKDLSHPAAPP